MKKNKIDVSTHSGGNTASRLRALRDRLLLQEDLNFLLTNRVPRSLMTHAMGRFSSIRSPLLTRASIALWQLFTDLDLRESKEQRFNSLQECFTRELKPGMRPVNPDPKILVSPCAVSYTHLTLPTN
jgi:phosphatidylserine decarboxylase